MEVDERGCNAANSCPAGRFGRLATKSCDLEQVEVERVSLAQHQPKDTKGLAVKETNIGAVNVLIDGGEWARPTLLCCFFLGAHGFWFTQRWAAKTREADKAAGQADSADKSGNWQQRHAGLRLLRGR